MAIIGDIYFLRTHFIGNKHWKKALDYFQSVLKKDSTDSLRLLNLPMNAFEKFYIDDDIYALEQRFISKDRSECFIESHMKYVDIQMIYSGYELMETGNINDLTVKETFKERDLIVYHDSNDLMRVPLSHGKFGVYFPEDAHLGCQMDMQKVECFKTVIKLPYSFLKNEGI